MQTTHRNIPCITCSGKSDRKARDAAFGDHRDVSFMGLDYGLDDSQPQASTFALALPGRIDPVKPVENPEQMLGWNFWPRILYAE